MTSSAFRAHSGLGVLVTCSVLLSVAAAVIVPSGPGADPRLTPPDESAHWLYVQDLARSLSLPVFGPNQANYEAHQPPLYYLTCLWCGWVGGEVGLRLARLWSALIGGLTLLVAWGIFGLLLGSAPGPRLAATAALALCPGRVFVMGSVSNDPLAELLSALTLYLGLKALSAGLTIRSAAHLGLALGLALLTKSTALVLIPMVALALVWDPGWREAGLRRLVLNGSAVAGVAALVWGWWVVRNLLLYGEPLAINVFQAVFLKDRATPEWFFRMGLDWTGYWFLVLCHTWWSLWGVFGQATVYMPGPFYTLGTVLAALAAVGWVLRSLRGGGPEKLPGRAWALGAVLFLLTLASFLRFNTVFYQAQARYFLGVSPVLAAVLGGGLCGLVAPARAHLIAWASGLLLGAMTVWALVAHVVGGYSFLPPLGG